jgi:hypothetical protein
MPRSIILITSVMLIVLGLAGCTADTAQTSDPAATAPPATSVTAPPPARLTATATPAPATLLVEAPDYRGVIFSADEAAGQRLEAIISADTAGFWSPNADDVARMEAQLLPVLLTDARLRAGIGIRRVRPLEEALPAYTRQYFGYLTADEEAVIYASFFCDIPIAELTSHWLHVYDGGDCFFQIQYTIATGQYFDLRVNGEA